MLPLSTAVIILFMMHNRVNDFILALSAAIIFNINPIYVVLAALVWKFAWSNTKPKQFTKIKPVANPMSSISYNKVVSNTLQYDYVLVGGNIANYFTAALLSKAGFKCCILSTPNDPKYEISIPGWATPIPRVSLVVGKGKKCQMLLDTVQKFDATRLVFKPVGTPDTNFLHTVLAVTSSLKGVSKRPLIIPLGAGIDLLASTLSEKHAVENVAVLQFLQMINKYYESLNSYIFSKLSASVEKSHVAKDFNELAKHNCLDLCAKICEQSDLFKSLSALSVVGADEATPSDRMTAISLASAISLCSEGAFYLSEGSNFLLNALEKATLDIGGAVFLDCPVQEIEIAQSGPTGKVLTATGVRLSDGNVIKATKGVIAGTGVLNTFCSLIPPQFVSSRTRKSLSGCEEARARLHVILELRGSVEELQLLDCDYIECRAQDVDDCSDSASLIDSYTKIWCPSARFSHIREAYPGNSIVVIELYPPADFCKLSEFTFSSPAVDAPEFDASDTMKPKLYSLGAKPSLKLGSPDKPAQSVIIQRAISRLKSVYPRTKDAVLRSYVAPPSADGCELSSLCTKYDANFSAITDIKNLFLCTSDLSTSGLTGEFLAGWLAASASLGYSLTDIITGRNIISDINNVTSQ